SRPASSGAGGSQQSQKVADLIAGTVQALARIDDEVGPRALFGVRRLTRQDRLELLGRHVRARQNALALNIA
ncbi:hypothetical protein ABXW85_23310, partial [Streptococcus suis]